MRSSLVALLMVVVVVRAAPKAGGHRSEAIEPDPDPDPLSLELATLQLLRSAVRKLGLLEQDAEAMTREQALLYLFLLHDHDRSEHLDGLELMQLLGTVLAQWDGERPDPDMVVTLVDRALERQDLNKDGLLDPHELLLSPQRVQEPPGQLLLQQPREMLAGAGAVPRGDVETPRGLTEVNSTGHGPAEERVTSQVEAPDAEAMEVEEAPEAEVHNTEPMEADEASEMGDAEGQTAPVWGDSGEG